jgi:shikimate kinase
VPALPERIFLIGLSGGGKSTVGPLVAHALGWTFVDSDREIEARDGRPVTRIFADDGESAFRMLEAATLGDLAARDRVVVACGGGAITDARSRAALAAGLVAWLRVAPAVAAARLDADPHTEDRPLLAGGARKRLEELLSRREPLYARADVVIDAGALSPEDAAAAIVEAWRSAAEAGRTLAPGRMEPA